MMKAKQSVKRGPMLSRWRRGVFAPSCFTLSLMFCDHTMSPHRLWRRSLTLVIPSYLSSRRRSLLKASYANQLLLESFRGLRPTLFARQHVLHGLDVGFGHLYVVLHDDVRR